MSSDYDKDRALIRRRLHAHRRLLARQLTEAPAPEGKKNAVGAYEPNDTFPRSITMRLLTTHSRQNLLLLAIAEIFPLLVRHFLRNAAEEQPEDRQRKLNI